MNKRQNDDLVSAKIRDFYDRHPYPPPVKRLDVDQQREGNTHIQRADFHLYWPANSYQEDLEILVAGCGTAQAARYALRQRKARITGIDISKTSIQETKKLKKQYNLTNLELIELPIEQVGSLKRKFDKIVCTGVLHHLPQPDMGLRALRAALKRDGALHLMVYAEYGRTGIYMLQEYCRRLGIGISDKEITDLAHTLMALPLDHPLAHILTVSPDFRRKAALGDALLNPQDRAYTVPQLFDLLQNSGLRFGRWLRQAPYLPFCGDPANTPHTDRLAQLPPFEQYAAVELFRGTILRHSAVCYRDDSQDLPISIQFDDDQWLSYIPHRLSKTITVEEELPPHTAAVFINQGHTHSDIYLPANQREKQLVKAIDGKRNIKTIIRSLAPEQEANLRTFVRKLWWYDQVSFELPKSH